MTEIQSTSRNPAWSRDELILALDFYVHHAGNPPGKASLEVLALSSLLNTIGHGRGVNSDFRNANGVYMKAMNFRRFDPAYIESGRVGLQRGGKDEAVVWETFSNDPARLRAAAEAIATNAGQADTDYATTYISVPDGLQEAEEGRLLTVQHVKRERSRTLVEAKKKSVVDAGGTLACEACGFDYEARYGEHGRGFIECHHIQPLHSLRPGTKTKLTDLALVCASCHRMIHAKPRWLTMVELRSVLTA